MIGPRWELVPTLPYHQHPTFAPITAARIPAGVGAGLDVDGRRFEESES